MSTFTPASRVMLQIDIDNARDLAHCWRVLPLLARWRVIVAIEQHRSQRRGHWHVTVILSRQLGRWEQIALQTILGSDRVREWCNWQRVTRRAPYPILFLERTQ